MTDIQCFYNLHQEVVELQEHRNNLQGSLGERVKNLKKISEELEGAFITIEDLSHCTKVLANDTAELKDAKRKLSIRNAELEATGKILSEQNQKLAAANLAHNNKEARLANIIKVLAYNCPNRVTKIHGKKFWCKHHEKTFNIKDCLWKCDMKPQPIGD